MDQQPDQMGQQHIPLKLPPPWRASSDLIFWVWTWVFQANFIKSTLKNLT
jgi:hypothetical protein